MTEKPANHMVFNLDGKVVHCNVQEGLDEILFESEQSEIVGIVDNRIVVLDKSSNNLMVFDFENILQYEREFPWAVAFHLYKGFIVVEGGGEVETLRMEDLQEFSFDTGVIFKGAHILKLEKKGIGMITSYISIYPLTGEDPEIIIKIPNIVVDAFTTNSHVYAIRYDQRIGVRAIPLDSSQDFIDYISEEPINEFEVTSENSLLLKFENHEELVIFTKEIALSFKGTSISGITVF